MINTYATFTKAILGTIYGIFIFTAVITHMWTVVIAFNEASLFGCVVTLFLPAIAEIYWMLKMYGENDTYAFIALIHIVIASLVIFLGRD